MKHAALALGCLCILTSCKSSKPPAARSGAAATSAPMLTSVGQSKYPGAIATDADLTVAKNNIREALGASINSTATTIPLSHSSTAIIPNMVVSIDAEIMFVCAVSSNTLTIGTPTACPSAAGRGYDGTTAANHSIGPCTPTNLAGCVVGNVTAIHHNSMAAEIKAIETTLGVNFSFVSHAPPNYATLNNLYNGTQFDIGGYPPNLQFGFNNAPVVQALVGSVNANGVSSAGNQAAGVAGYAQTISQYSNGVGVYGGGTCAGALSQCWGANFTTQQVSAGTGGSLQVGVEVDVNHSNTGADRAAIIKGITSVANLPTKPSGYANAYEAVKTAVSYAWDNAFQSDAGAAVNAFVAGAAAASGAAQSQNLLLASSNGSSQFVSQIFADPSGNLILRPASAKGVIFDPGQTGNGTVIATGQGGLLIAKNAFASLPACIAGLEGLMWPVTDSATNTWGAQITGGGSNHVLAYCDGTQWTVAAK